MSSEHWSADFEPGSDGDLEPSDSVIPHGQPEDLIAAAWGQLGYRPSNSLVLVGLEGERLRTGLVCRVDLPTSESEEPLAAKLGSVLAIHGHLAAVGLIFSPDALEPPQPSIVGHLSRVLPLADVQLVDAIGVNDSAFRSYFCDVQDCCPSEGFPIRRVESSRAAALYAFKGRLVVPSERELLSDVTPSPRSTLRTPLTEVVDGQLPDAVRRRVLEDWLDAQDSDEPALDHEQAALLAARLEDVVLRDALLVATTWPHAEHAFTILAGADTPASAFTHPPDRTRLRTAEALLAAAAREAAPGQRAPALGALGWLGWYAGAGVRARLLTELALADRPGYRMSMLVRELLSTTVPPPWVAAESGVES